MTNARDTQTLVQALETADAKARATVIYAQVLEKPVLDPKSRATNLLTQSLETIGVSAKVTNVQVQILEALEDNNTRIDARDRALRRTLDGIDYNLTRFIDEYAPDEMASYPCTAAPRWFHRITTSDSGSDLINPVWEHPLSKFTLPEAVRDQATYEAVLTHWLVMGGPTHTWPWRNPLDYASCPLTLDFRAEEITPLDQRVGFGDGVTTQFQLLKRYQAGAQFYDFPIVLPVIGSVTLSVGGAHIGHEHWTITRYGGIITFDAPPAPGLEIRSGFIFDHEVHFDGDDGFAGMMQSYAASGYGAITLVGVRSDDD